MDATPPETSTPWYQGDDLLASAVHEQRDEQAPPDPTIHVDRRRREAAGYTYVIRGTGTGLHKIGRTTTAPLERLQKLQTGSPVALELVVVLDHVRWEAVLHHHYRDQRRQGEWFELDERDIEQIRAWSISAA